MRYFGHFYGPGCGFGYHHGYGRVTWGYGWCHEPYDVGVPEDYEYLGPCRCGDGPHAFYRNKKTGRIFRGFRHRFWPGSETSEENLKDELEGLRRRKEELEKRISEIEAKLRQEGK